MKNKVLRIGLLAIMCLTISFGTAATAFAYTGEDASGSDEDVVTVWEDIPEEETTEDAGESTEIPAEEVTEDSDPTIDRSGLTPDGNMDLVDDLTGEEADAMQFLTVTTKSGHTFYIVIVRGKDTENVHFLNQVDEADLMALMSEEEKEQFVKENTTEETQPVITPTEIPQETTEPEVTESEKPEKQGNNSLAILAVFGVIGAAVAAGYYVMKIKPGKKGSSLDDDLEFYDDEEYENEDDNLYQAALCRSEADWLVGINATRLFTTLYNKRLTVGRVQTPTLAMLVARNDAVSHFIKEKYFNVHLKSDGLEVVKEKIFSEDEAKHLMETCNGVEAMVTSVVQTRKVTNPPKLYDLTTLQREANRYFGYTAQQTLDTTQALYEKKLVTYPRTDSQFLTEDMAETAREMVELIRNTFDFGIYSSGEPDVKRVINNVKVSDHHAIIPTAEIRKQDLSSLSDRESDILKLIAQQLLCATGSRYEYLETEIKVSCMGEEFTAKGKQVLSAGWKTVEAAYKGKAKGKDADENASSGDKILPEVRQGQRLFPVWAELSEHFTSPPKQYTEDSLLSAMETAGNEHFDEDTEKKGLGTPATRASMIEKLVSSGYVRRKGKQLIPTEDGINLAAVMPEEIKSPKLTAEWENTLMQMEKGQVRPDAFMTGITSMVKGLTEKYNALSGDEENRFQGGSGKEVIGTCPRCGSPVYEGQKNFYCSNKECRFCIWKESKWLSGMKKKVTPKMAKALLSTGRVHVTGLYSVKKDKTFDADLVLDDTGEYVNFKLDFPPAKGGRKK